MAMTNVDDIEIRDLAERFVGMWAKAETDDLGELLAPGCDLDFSIFDRDITAAGLARELAARPHRPTYTRFEIHNYACVVGTDEASQCFAITGVFVDETDGAPATFSFSAFMINRLTRTAEGWRYTELHFELGYGNDTHMRLRTCGVQVDRMDGDVSFVENWQLVEPVVGWHKGSRLLRIVPEVDVPWYAIEDRAFVGDDEQQIHECLFAYCFGIDLDIVQLYTEVFSDDATATYNYDRLYNKRTVTEMLKFERAGMIGMGHILDFDGIRFEGDLAYAHVYRAALNAVPSAWFAGQGKHDNWYNARYDLVFAKEADGVWRIKKLEYFQDMIKVPLTEGVFVVEVGE